MRTECCFIMVNQKDQCTDKKQDFWPRHTARALDSDLGFAFYTVVLVLDLHLSADHCAIIFSIYKILSDRS